MVRTLALGRTGSSLLCNNNYYGCSCGRPSVRSFSLSFYDILRLGFVPCISRTFCSTILLSYHRHSLRAATTIRSRASGLACSRLPFSERTAVVFWHAQDMSLSLKGPGAANGEQLTVGITMRRLGQYKTAWPATMTTLLQAGSTTLTDQVCQIQ